MFDWWKERKVALAARQEVQRKAIEAFKVALAELSLPDADPAAGMEKIVQLTRLQTALADAFRPGWRQVGYCDLRWIWGLRSVRKHLGEVFLSSESIF